MDQQSSEQTRKRYHFHSSCKISEKEKIKIKRCDAFCDCSDASCPNAGAWTECPAICNKKPGKCQNQHFRSKNPLPITIKKTKKKGFGGFANEFMNPDSESVVLPFVGEVVTLEEWEKRVEKYAKNNTPSYSYQSEGYVIDATVHGNATKFINHSCDPNLRAESWKVEGAPRDFRGIALVPIKEIGKGTELTLDYGFGAEEDLMITCKCGATKCSGIVGKTQEDLEKMKEMEEMETEEVEVEVKTQKVVKNKKEVHVIHKVQNKNKIQKVQKFQTIQKYKVQTKIEKIQLEIQKVRVLQKQDEVQKSPEKVEVQKKESKIPLAEVHNHFLRSRVVK